MRRAFFLTFCSFLPLLAEAGQTLTLEECRDLALQNNKELKIAEEELDVASYKKKSARTKYFPDLSVKGAYLRNEKDLSLIGEDMYLPIGTVMPDGSFGFRQEQIGNQWTLVNGQPVPLDANGQPFNPKSNPEKIMWKDYTTIPKEELTFDSKNVYVGALNLMQPVFMGGKIIAYNKIAKLNESLAESKLETGRRNVSLSVEEAYWQVVSLSNKRKAVEALVELLDKMSGDVKAMMEAGVATKADELSVLVKKNEAEMALLKVENGVSLSKMLLAQYCGLPLDEEITLADENAEIVSSGSFADSVDIQQIYENRPEVRSLGIAQQIYEQKANVARADMMPTVALAANYIAMNPNLSNGYKTDFDFTWNVGVVVNIPLLHWGESIYNYKAAKGEANIAGYKLSGTQEKIELQVSQSLFRLKEARRKLEVSAKNLESADENLRYATVGFEEGVVPASALLEAQTVWLNAKSNKIDAEVEAKLSEVRLRQAMGVLSVK